MARKLILLNLECGPKYCDEFCQGLQEMDARCGVFRQELKRVRGKPLRHPACVEAEAGSECLEYSFVRTDGLTEIACVDAENLERHVSALARDLQKERSKNVELREELQKSGQNIGTHRTPGNIVRRIASSPALCGSPDTAESTTCAGWNIETRNGGSTSGSELWRAKRR